MFGRDLRESYPHSERKRLFGFYPAVVTDVRDVQSRGEIEVELPWVPGQEAKRSRVRARLATMMAGPSRGSFFVPDPEDEVLIGFMGGDPRWPVVVGSMWNGNQTPPEQMDGQGHNDVRSFTSRNGARISFEESWPATPGGACTITVETAQGRELVLDDEAGTVTVRTGPTASVVLDQSGSVEIFGASGVKVQSGGTVTVQAPMLDCKAPVAEFAGVVICKLLKSDMVVSTAYTPGAGNVL